MCFLVIFVYNFFSKFYYVVDLGNLYNNVMDVCDFWDYVVKKVRKFLKVFLFLGL